MGSVSGGNFYIEENSLFRSCVLKTLPALKDIVRFAAVGSKYDSIRFS